MAYFDFLIDKDKNSEPKQDKEYIYNLDMVWKTTFDTREVEYGIIVENVVREKSGRYSFNIKGETERYNCTYSWAFIENTEENIDLYHEYKNNNIKVKELERINKQIIKKISLFK